MKINKSQFDLMLYKYHTCKKLILSFYYMQNISIDDSVGEKTASTISLCEVINVKYRISIIRIKMKWALISIINDTLAETHIKT